MITKLISDNAPKRIVKPYMFNKMSNNKILFSFREYPNYMIRGVILRRPRTIRHCVKWSKRFSWFNNTDVFGNFVSALNSYQLTELAFSVVSSKIHHKCNYEEH